MVFTRKYGRKRTFGKRYKKRAYSNKRRPRSSRGVNKNVHYFKRTAILTVSMVADGFTAFVAANNEFSLDKVPGYAEYVAMFDSYKIKAVARKYTWTKDGADALVANDSAIARLITVRDYNDAVALADEAEALQYTTYKNERLTHDIKRYFKPAMSKGDGSYGRSGWLTTSQATIKHYAIKSAFDTPSVSGYLKIYDTYYVAFKNQK